LILILFDTLCSRRTAQTKLQRSDHAVVPFEDHAAQLSEDSPEWTTKYRLWL